MREGRSIIHETGFIMREETKPRAKNKVLGLLIISLECVKHAINLINFF